MHHPDLYKRILIALIVASTLLAGVLCFLVCFWIVRQKRLKKASGKSSIRNSGPALIPTIGKLSSSGVGGKQGSLAVFEYQLLEAAANHFAESNIVGKGNFGLVYEARFSEKLIAAVKKLDIIGLDSQRGFEVAAVAVLCVQPEPSYRPLITDVLHSLIPLTPSELGGV